MKLTNLSAEPLGRIHSWLPHDLKAEEVVFLPDACPGKSPLPTGTATRTLQPDWRRFAVSDCGCGMRLLRSELSPSDLTTDRWDALAERLRRSKGGLGDLGGGNHFLDALLPYDEGPLHFLVHTGSRAESGHVDAFVDNPERFDREFARVVGWAADNRAAVHEAIAAVFGPLESLLDLPHNTVEYLPEGGAIIRKGAVQLLPGELTVIPSHFLGDAVLVRATSKIEEILHSMSHGTGRALPRGESKTAAAGIDFDAVRRRVMIPTSVSDASLRSDGPHAYRDLDACLPLIDEFVEEIERYSPIAYLGHL